VCHENHHIVKRGPRCTNLSIGGLFRLLRHVGLLSNGSSPSKPIKKGEVIAVLQGLLSPAHSCVDAASSSGFLSEMDLCLQVIEPHMFTACLVQLAALKFKNVESSMAATRHVATSLRQRQLTKCVRLLFEQHLLRFAFQGRVNTQGVEDVSMVMTMPVIDEEGVAHILLHHESALKSLFHDYASAQLFTDEVTGRAGEKCMSLMDYLRCLQALRLFNFVGPEESGVKMRMGVSQMFSTEWDGKEIDAAVQTFSLPLKLVSAEVQNAKVRFKDFSSIIVGLAFRKEANPFLSAVQRVGAFIEQLLERYNSLRLECTN
jgi:hypothetical protein